MPTPSRLTGPYTIKIAGKNMHAFGMLATQIQNLDLTQLEYAVDVYPGEHAGIAHEASFVPRPFVIAGRITADSAADLRTNINALKAFLGTLRGKLFETVAPVQVYVADQTDRYFKAVYRGPFQMANPRRSVGNQYVDFALPMTLLSPFAESPTVTTANPSGSGPSFQVFTLGSAPSWLLLELEGASTNPDFVLTDRALYVDFDYDLVGTEIDGSSNTGTSGAGTPGDQFEPGEYGGRYYQQSTFSTTWSSVVNNEDEQTWVFYLQPQFGMDPGADVFVFQYYVDASNSIYLYWDDSEDEWVVVKVTGGSPDVLNVADTFSAGDNMVLAVSFGPDGMKFYKDGVLKTSNAATTGISGTSGTLYLGDQGATYRPDAKFELLAAAPFQYSNDDVTRLSFAPEQMPGTSVKKSYTGTISANTRVVVDFEKGTAISVNPSTLVHSNVLANFTDSEGLPILSPPKSCLYIPSGETIGGVKTAFRKRYL